MENNSIPHTERAGQDVLEGRVIITTRLSVLDVISEHGGNGARTIGVKQIKRLIGMHEHHIVRFATNHDGSDQGISCLSRITSPRNFLNRHAVSSCVGKVPIRSSSTRIEFAIRRRGKSRRRERLGR